MVVFYVRKLIAVKFQRSEKVKTWKNRLAFLVPVLALTATATAANGSAETATAGIPFIWWIAPAGSILALFFALYFYKKVMAAPEGNEKMVEIATYVREGSYAYLFSQYKVVGLVFVLLFIIFTALAYVGVQNPIMPVAFLSAGFFSALCGFLGMKTATNASSRTAQGATKSLNSALQVAFRSGAVMGLIVVGFGLLNITIWYLILDKLIYTAEHMANGLRFCGLKESYRKVVIGCLNRKLNPLI